MAGALAVPGAGEVVAGLGTLGNVGMFLYDFAKAIRGAKGILGAIRNAAPQTLTIVGDQKGQVISGLLDSGLRPEEIPSAAVETGAWVSAAIWGAAEINPLNPLIGPMEKKLLQIPIARGVQAASSNLKRNLAQYGIDIAKMSGQMAGAEVAVQSAVNAGKREAYDNAVSAGTLKEIINEAGKSQYDTMPFIEVLREAAQHSYDNLPLTALIVAPHSLARLAKSVSTVKEMGKTEKESQLPEADLAEEYSKHTTPETYIDKLRQNIDISNKMRDHDTETQMSQLKAAGSSGESDHVKNLKEWFTGAEGKNVDPTSGMSELDFFAEELAKEKGVTVEDMFGKKVRAQDIADVLGIPEEEVAARAEKEIGNRVNTEVSRLVKMYGEKTELKGEAAARAYLKVVKKTLGDMYGWNSDLYKTGSKLATEAIYKKAGVELKSKSDGLSGGKTEPETRTVTTYSTDASAGTPEKPLDVLVKRAYDNSEYSAQVVGSETYSDGSKTWKIKLPNADGSYRLEEVPQNLVRIPKTTVEKVEPKPEQKPQEPDKPKTTKTEANTLAPPVDPIAITKIKPGEDRAPKYNWNDIQDAGVLKGQAAVDKRKEIADHINEKYGTSVPTAVGGKVSAKDWLATVHDVMESATAGKYREGIDTKNYKTPAERNSASATAAREELNTYDGYVGKIFYDKEGNTVNVAKIVSNGSGEIHAAVRTAAGEEKWIKIDKINNPDGWMSEPDYKKTLVSRLSAQKKLDKTAEGSKLRRLNVLMARADKMPEDTAAQRDFKNKRKSNIARAIAGLSPKSVGTINAGEMDLSAKKTFFDTLAGSGKTVDDLINTFAADDTFTKEDVVELEKIAAVMEGVKKPEDVSFNPEFLRRVSKGLGFGEVSTDANDPTGDLTGNEGVVISDPNAKTKVVTQEQVDLVTELEVAKTDKEIEEALKDLKSSALFSVKDVIALFELRKDGIKAMMKEIWGDHIELEKKPEAPVYKKGELVDSITTPLQEDIRGGTIRKSEGKWYLKEGSKWREITDPKPIAMYEELAIKEKERKARIETNKAETEASAKATKLKSMKQRLATLESIGTTDVTRKLREEIAALEGAPAEKPQEAIARELKLRFGGTQAADGENPAQDVYHNDATQDSIYLPSGSSIDVVRKAFEDKAKVRAEADAKITAKAAAEAKIKAEEEAAAKFRAQADEQRKKAELDREIARLEEEKAKLEKRAEKEGIKLSTVESKIPEETERASYLGGPSKYAFEAKDGRIFERKGKDSEYVEVKNKKRLGDLKERFKDQSGSGYTMPKFQSGVDMTNTRFQFPDATLESVKASGGRVDSKLSANDLLKHSEQFSRRFDRTRPFALLSKELRRKYGSKLSAIKIRYRTGSDELAVFIPDENTIEIDLGNKNLARSEISVILHEALHGVTFDAIEAIERERAGDARGYRVSEITEIQRYGYSDLQKIKAEFDRRLEGIPEDSKPFGIKNLKYAGKDMHEFISMLMTNHDVQRFLSEMPKLSGKPTIWRRISTAFRKVLGLRGGTALDSAIDAVIRLSSNKDLTDRDFWPGRDALHFPDTTAKGPKYKTPDELRKMFRKAIKDPTSNFNNWYELNKGRLNGKNLDAFNEFRRSPKVSKNPEAREVEQQLSEMKPEEGLGRTRSAILAVGRIIKAKSIAFARQNTTIGTMAKIISPKLYKIVQDRLEDSQRRYADLKNKVNEFMEKEGYDAAVVAYDPKREVTEDLGGLIGKTLMSRAQRFKLVRMFQNEETALAAARSGIKVPLIDQSGEPKTLSFMDATGKVPEEIAFEAQKVAEKLKSWSDRILASEMDTYKINKLLDKAFDEIIFPEVLDAFNKTNGKDADLKQVQHYIRTNREHGLDIENHGKSAFVTLEENWSSAKNRKGSTDPIIIDDAFVSAAKSAQDASRYAGYAENLKALREIVGDSGDGTAEGSMQKLIDSRHGKGTAQDFLNRIFDVEGVVDRNDYGAVRKLMQMQDVARLSGPGTILKQIPAAFLPALDHGIGNTLRAMLTPRDSAFRQKVLDGKWGGALKLRLASHKFVEELTENRDWKPKRLRKVESLSMAPMRIVDEWSVKRFMDTAAEEIESEGKLKIGSQEYYDEIGHRATRMVNELQPSGYREYRTALHNGGLVGLVLNRYRTSTNAIANSLYRTYLDAKSDPNDRAKMAKFLATTATVMGAQALVFSGTDILTANGKALSQNRGDDDAKDKLEKFNEKHGVFGNIMEGVSANLVQQVPSENLVDPLARGLISYIRGADMQDIRKYEEWSVAGTAPPLQMVYDFGRRMLSANATIKRIHSKEEMTAADESAIKKAMKTIYSACNDLGSELFGLPFKHIDRYLNVSGLVADSNPYK